MSKLLKTIVGSETRILWPLPTAEEAAADVSVILKFFELQSLRRYFNQVHWQAETREAIFADRAEPGLKLENVAAHSWQVADTVLLLAPHFEFLDLNRSIELALVHDKLEVFTGDFDPIGPDGRGTFAHSFNPDMSSRKVDSELAALAVYLNSLRPSVRERQESLLLESISGTSNEAKFVRGVDKLQAMAFVHLKKSGVFTDEHLVFTIRYSKKIIEHFSGLYSHYLILLELLLNKVAARRGCNRETLEALLFGQLELELRTRK